MTQKIWRFRLEKGRYLGKVQLFYVKTMRMIAQIFVAFSEKLNFKNTPPENLSPNFVYSTKPTFFGSKPRTKDPKGTI